MKTIFNIGIAVLCISIIGGGAFYIYKKVKNKKIKNKSPCQSDHVVTTSVNDCDEDGDDEDETCFEDVEDQVIETYNNFIEFDDDCNNPDFPECPITIEEYEARKKADLEAFEKAKEEVDNFDRLVDTTTNSTAHIENELDYYENLIDYDVWHTYISAVSNPRKLPRPDIRTNEKPIYITYFSEDDTFVEMGFKCPEIPISRIVCELDVDETEYFENTADNNIVQMLCWTYSGEEVNEEVDRCVQVYIKVLNISMKDRFYYRIDETGKFYESMQDRNYYG